MNLAIRVMFLQYIPSIVDMVPLRWRHNGHDSVSNHQPYHCLLTCLFRRRSKKTSKFRVTGLCVGNSLGTGEFPAQMAMENVSIWWRHHVIVFPCGLVAGIYVNYTNILQGYCTGSGDEPWFSVVMPPPLGAGGIMFSGCPSVRPSVRSLKYPLLTCT